MNRHDQRPVQRVEHYRGPGRGDGNRRRSIAWMRMRDDGLTRACTHRVVVPAPRGLGGEPRRLACGAEPGELCRDPRTGEALDRQPCHAVRLRPSTNTPPTEEGTS